MFQTTSKREYINPYKHGVLIGNFVEDIFGQDLVKKYNIEKPYTNYVSESAYRYSDPRLVPNKNIKPYNSSANKPFADINIDFSKKTVQDIQAQINTKEDQYQSQSSGFMSNSNENQDPLSSSQRDKVLSRLTELRPDVKEEIGPQVEKFAKKDMIGLYYTTKSGLNNSLLKGHGPNQHKFGHNEYISVKQLTIDKNERTDDIFNPHYSTKEKFSFPSKFEPKDTSEHKRMYKHYGEFTKKFDKITHKQ